MFLELVKKQAELFEQTDPDRIYVENVRSFFRIPSKLAKLLCELAVRERLFVKMYGYYCPNNTCSRLIYSSQTKEELKDKLKCSLCESLEVYPYSFLESELEIMEFYQLKNKS